MGFLMELSESARNIQKSRASRYLNRSIPLANEDSLAEGRNVSLGGNVDHDDPHPEIVIEADTCKNSALQWLAEIGVFNGRLDAPVIRLHSLPEGIGLATNPDHKLPTNRTGSDLVELLNAILVRLVISNAEKKDT